MEYRRHLTTITERKDVFLEGKGGLIFFFWQIGRGVVHLARVFQNGGLGKEEYELGLKRFD